MKNILILYFIMITTLFSQPGPPNWNSIVSTNIPFNWGSLQQGKIDQFANKDGIHVFLISSPSSPAFRSLYYLINSSGNIVRNMEFELSSATFPGIDGDDNKIYIVYKLGNSIIKKKSTDEPYHQLDMPYLKIQKFILRCMILMK